MSAVHAAADGEAQWMALEWPCPGPRTSTMLRDDISGGKAARHKASYSYAHSATPGAASCTHGVTHEGLAYARGAASSKKRAKQLVQEEGFDGLYTTFQ